MRSRILGLVVLACIQMSQPAEAGFPQVHAKWDPKPWGQYFTGVAADEGFIYIGDRYGIQKFTHEGALIGRFGGELFSRDFVLDGSGTLTVLDVKEGRLVQLDANGRLMRHWSNNGAHCTGLALDAAGRVYADLRPPGQVRVFGSDGTPISDIPVLGTPMAVTSEGDVLLTDRLTLKRFSPDGTLHGEIDGPWRTPAWIWDVVIDDQDRVIVLEGAKVHVFSAGGDTLLTSWEDPNPQGMCLTPQGNLVVASNWEVKVYEPLGEITLPPPPPVILPTMLLHISDVLSSAPCQSVPLSPEHVVTSAPADPTTLYTVYLLATRGTVNGLAGFQMGITYDGAPESEGIEISEWSRCSDLEFPQESWPASGSGNTVTWAIPGNCQGGDYAVAGFFRVTVSSPSLMSIVDYSASGKVKLADCYAAELDLAHDLEPPQIGWISFGGKARENDTDGCNPLLAPCGSVVPVRPTTWGRIKSSYR